MLKSILLSSGCLFSLFLTACVTGTPENAVPVRFETFSVEEKSVLECDPAKPSMNISVALRYAAAAPNPAVPAIINREILKTALKPVGEKSTLRLSPDFAKTVKDYIAEEAKCYQETWTEIYNDWGHSVGSENIISVRGNPRGFADNTIAYCVEIDRDMGGAHPIHFKYFLNFDAGSGKRLTLSDIFTPDYEKTLTDLLMRKAMALENVTIKSKLSCEPRPTENFAVESDGILFYFNPYDIAEYSRGSISIKLRYGELAAILKNAPAKP